LDEHFGKERRIASLQRRPSAYRSSFLLEELDVLLEDGTSLPILFKDLSWQALLPEACEAKPAFLYDPQREIDTYRGILAEQRLGTPACYGAVVDRQADRYWLFLERVNGCALWQVGEVGVWRAAARWLAVLHHRLAGTAGLAATRLLHHDADYYQVWMQRALAFAREPGPACVSRSQDDFQNRNRTHYRHVLEGLAERYTGVVQRLAALPATFIHGEFYPSNILIEERDSGLRVCPVDWEMAAVGPGLIDLAALTAGTWTQDEKEAIALAYHETLLGMDAWSGTDDFLAALDLCHLHLAVQWLGWSPRWTPPPEHAHGWLDEALRLAKKLRL
jgi:hypothetical protein